MTADAPPDSAGPGLRARKKRATRQALGAAAMRLAIERGLENVVIEDIAAAADVSPRTFSNYFASKYEAICALALDRSAAIGEALRERPAGESLWDAVRQAVLEVYARGSMAPDPELIAGIRLVTSSPVLRGEYLKALALMQYELADALTDRAGGTAAGSTAAGSTAAGSTAAGPLFMRGFAAAVTAVVQAATERWLYADPPVPLTPVIEDALRELATGMHAVLPAPTQIASLQPFPTQPAPTQLALTQPENPAPSAADSG
jgi:AcrR family transcriptional regulator